MVTGEREGASSSPNFTRARNADDEEVPSKIIFYYFSKSVEVCEEKESTVVGVSVQSLSVVSSGR